MADQAETTDTSVQDAVDTSTNDEAQDPEADLENMEGFDVDDDSEETEEQEESEEAEDESEAEEPDEAEESEEDVEQKPEPKKQEAQSDEEQRKAHNREMAQQRLKEKQEREKNIVDSQRKYVDEAKDDHDRALRELQVDAYNNKVESNSNKLTNGFERALKDFPVLQNTSPEIQAEVDSAIDAFQAMHVKLDQYGNPVEVRADFYKYLQTKADSIERLTKIGARKQEENKSREKSKTFTPPDRAPKQPKSDPELDAFDEEAKRW